MAFDAVEEVYSVFPWLAQLGGSSGEIYQVLIDGILNGDPSSVIVQNVRNTNTWKARFSGIVARTAAGLPAITEAEYLQLETGYREQFRQFNILGTLGLTDETAFRAFASEYIAGDVSVQELNYRLDRGVALMRDSSEYIQQAFQEWYGVTPTEDAMLVYFLDDKKGLDIIEDQLATATIGGEAFKYGLNITRTRAEILRKEGVTGDLARQGFADIAREEPVLSRLAQIHNTTPLSQQQLEEFVFHDDPTVAEQRYRTFSTALASFQAGGARNPTQVGGIGELVDPNRTV